MTRAVLAWSGGKDAAFALGTLQGTDVEVVELLTTINREVGRSTMHGVRRPLYERQAAALGRPINLVSLPPAPSNEAYEAVMADELDRYRDRGIRRVVFADVCLEDVRAYRESQLAGTGIEGCWPLWGRDTAALAAAILDAGVRAVVVAADAAVFDDAVVGRPYDEAFVEGLPPGVDPCGENGEFHTFVWDGPGFEQPVPVDPGETVTRPVGDGAFHYVELHPAPGG